MIIKIAGLDDGTYVYDFEDGVDKLNLDEPFFGNYNTKVVLNKFEDQIILEAQTNIAANFTCDRCGSEFKGNVESNYKMVYLLRDMQGENDSLDVTYLSAHTDKIVIDNDVRDYILLSVPMKKLCKNDCKGLCFKCGTNLNEHECDCSDDEIDERLNPLLKLKDKLNKN